MGALIKLLKIVVTLVFFVLVMLTLCVLASLIRPI